MSTTQVLIAGFGGQGILFAGKFLAYTGLLGERNVSWLPSYGPEMRGGTANCSVILSDTPVGSPIVTSPDILVAMNLPSLEKYESAAKTGGLILVDSSLIAKKVERTDVKTVYIPATTLATENELSGLANMIMTGALIAHADCEPEELIEPALTKVVSAKHADLFDKNLEAIKLGMSYEK